MRQKTDCRPKKSPFSKFHTKERFIRILVILYPGAPLQRDWETTLPASFQNPEFIRGNPVLHFEASQHADG